MLPSYRPWRQRPTCLWSSCWPCIKGGPPAPPQHPPQNPPSLPQPLPQLQSPTAMPQPSRTPDMNSSRWTHLSLKHTQRPQIHRSSQHSSQQGSVQQRPQQAGQQPMLQHPPAQLQRHLTTLRSTHQSPHLLSKLLWSRHRPLQGRRRSLILPAKLPCLRSWREGLPSLPPGPPRGFPREAWTR